MKVAIAVTTWNLWFSIGHVGIPAALSHEFNYFTTSLTHSCIPLISFHVVSFYFLSFISMYSFPSVFSTHLFPYFHSINDSFHSNPFHVMSCHVSSFKCTLSISISSLSHFHSYHSISSRLRRVNNLHDRIFGTKTCKQQKTTEWTWLRCTKQIGVGLIWVQKKTSRRLTMEETFYVLWAFNFQEELTFAPTSDNSHPDLPLIKFAAGKEWAQATRLPFQPQDVWSKSPWSLTWFTWKSAPWKGDSFWKPWFFHVKLQGWKALDDFKQTKSSLRKLQSSRSLFFG